MLKNAFEEIMERYSQAKTEPIKDHILANFINNDLPNLFKDEFPEYNHLIWKASSGLGNWATSPWLAILNPLITETPQKGYYPVYIFSAKLDKVYLSFNQGVTSIREEFNTSESRDILQHRAKILDFRLRNEFDGDFSNEPIDLDPPNSNSNLAFYELGHSFGKCYLKDSLPSSEQIVSDLSKMLKIYDKAFFYGGTSEFDNSLSDEEEDQPQETYEEKRRFRFHKTLERNQALANAAKRKLGYVCEVCGFDFEKIYGSLGKNYIEAHHKIPLSSLKGDGPIELNPEKDFAVLCANCHRMAHRQDAPEDYEEFKKMYETLNQ